MHALAIFFSIVNRYTFVTIVSLPARQTALITDAVFNVASYTGSIARLFTVLSKVAMHAC